MAVTILSKSETFDITEPTVWMDVDGVFPTADEDVLFDPKNIFQWDVSSSVSVRPAGDGKVELTISYIPYFDEAFYTDKDGVYHAPSQREINKYAGAQTGGNIYFAKVGDEFTGEDYTNDVQYGESAFSSKVTVDGGDYKVVGFFHED